MAIRWTIPFKSLRSGTLYTVNIHDASYSGNPIPLRGAAQPFTTEESQEEDQFMPIRTQSGYIRIFDNGRDANGNAFNWKSLLPDTDTDRPVTLTDGNGNIVWHGFMQAQNFSGTLYGNPQEREFPVQCSLTVCQGADINFQEKSIHNFAYLLKTIIDSIPQTARPTTFMIQGGADAQRWLLKLIDWQTFADENSDGVMEARYSMYQCLEDMCSFWGWTARTSGQTLFLTCTDDAAERTWLSLSTAELATMAGGTSAGTTGIAMITSTPTGSIFASTSNDDFVQRGVSKAVVQVKTGDSYKKEIEFAPEPVDRTMRSQPKTWVQEGNSGYYVYDPIYNFEAALMKGQANVNADFCFEEVYETPSAGTECDMIRIHRNINYGPYASLETLYSHVFNNGFFVLKCSVYVGRQRLNGDEDKTMSMRFGVGETRATARWWAYNSISGGWSDDPTAFSVVMDNPDETLRLRWITYPESGMTVTYYTPCIPAEAIMHGKIFVDFLGCGSGDGVPETDGYYKIQIANFDVEYKQGTVTMPTYSQLGAIVEDTDNVANQTYTATNTNRNRDSINVDIEYGSDKNMQANNGVLIDTDYKRLQTVLYGSSSEIPEQHLANRIAAYWSKSRRMVRSELRSEAIPAYTPQYFVVLDGTTFHPISVSRDWWNDITTITLLEMDV